MKKTLVVANWKMNPASLKEAKDLFAESKKIRNSNCRVVVCPPFPYLAFGKGVLLGAQNCFCKDPVTGKGPFTGETSPSMIKDLGCEYVIVGHSERREILGEKEEEINGKIKSVISAGLSPILCVGEKKEEGATGEIKKQLKEGLKGVSSTKKVIIAYEPLFAIGTGKPCDVDLAAKRRVFIRSVLSKISSASKNLPVLYGGSVDEKNCRRYIEEGGFEGLLVGGASLKPEKFKKIVDKL